MPDKATYTLSVVLQFTDLLSGKLGKTVSALKGLRKDADSALKSFRALRKEMGAGVSVANLTKFDTKLKTLKTDARSLSWDVGKLYSALGKSITTPGLDKALQATRAIQRATRDTRPAPARAPRRQGYQPGDWMNDSERPRDWRNEPRGPVRRPRERPERLGYGERLERLDDSLQSAGQVASVWGERADSLSRYTDETKRLLLARERFKVIGLSEAENRQAFEAVGRTVRQIKGLTVAETTESMLDLVGALGDVKQAAQLLPLASKYKLGFDVLFGDQMGEAERSTQVLNSFKSLEYLGATQKGPEETARVLDTITQIGNATGGRVTPGEVLTMLRRGKVASRGLSAEGLRNVSTLIEDMSAPTVGTALMSLYQGIVGGQMGQAPALLHQKYGLIDPGKIQYTKAGMLKKVMPGGHKLSRPLQEDPLKFADALTESLRKGGVNVEDEQELRGVLAQMFPNRNAFAMVDSLITQRQQVSKESGRAAKSKGALKTADQLEGTDLLKLKEYEAAWTNFKAEMGGPLLKMTADVVKGLRPMLELAAEYPKTAAGILLVTKSFTGLVQTTALLYRGGAGLYEFFSGVRAGAGGAAAAVEGVTGRATGLRGVLAKLNSPVSIGIGLTAASLFTIYELTELYKVLQELKAAKAQAASANTGNLGTINKAREEFAREGKPVPQAIWKTQASGALAKLNANNELKDALKGWTLGSFTRQMNPFAPEVPYAGMRRFAPTSVNTAHTIRQRAPELREPEIMAELRKAIDSWHLPKESRASLDKALQAAFPDSFNKASQLAAEELSKIAPAAEFTAEGLLRLYVPTVGLGVGMGSAQNAAVSFASRLNSLDLRSSLPQLYLPTATANAPAKPGTPFNFSQPFTFTPPRSAIGSVVQKDGLVSLHRGNVVTPAKLSRRRPGDWLDALAAAGGATPAIDGGAGALSIEAPVNINIHGAADPSASAAAVREEMGRHRADLELLIRRLTDRRRIERVLSHRKSVWEEKAA